MFVLYFIVDNKSYYSTATLVITGVMGYAV